MFCVSKTAHWWSWDHVTHVFAMMTCATDMIFGQLMLCGLLLLIYQTFAILNREQIWFSKIICINHHRTIKSLRLFCRFFRLYKSFNQFSFVSVSFRTVERKACVTRQPTSIWALFWFWNWNPLSSSIGLMLLST